ncbi:MAG: hypothetical protein NTU91_12590 [Chloroflexi bacterium]|nr:hypothetical protein [Chloroflexota bacterium]
MADYSRAADFFLARKDLSGILDSERRVSFLHELRIPLEAPPDSEKAKRLQTIHFAASLTHREWTWSSEKNASELLSYLGDPEPDVRAYASLRLRGLSFFAPEAKKWLVDYYRKCLSADDDRAPLVGRHVGDLLFMGPDDVFPADLIWLKLGKDIPRVFVNCTCAHCGSRLCRGHDLTWGCYVDLSWPPGLPTLATTSTPG